MRVAFIESVTLFSGEHGLNQIDWKKICLIDQMPGQIQLHNLTNVEQALKTQHLFVHFVVILLFNKLEI